MDRRTVLIVDDDEDESESIRDVLTMSHYNVEIARNEKAASAIVESQPIGLALIDSDTAGRDAFELYRRLASMRPRLLGAFLCQDRPIEGMEPGTTIWISKPIIWKRTLGGIDSLFRSLNQT
jgi:DNA-binding response OmpR family regulator